MRPKSAYLHESQDIKSTGRISYRNKVSDMMIVNTNRSFNNSNFNGMSSQRMSTNRSVIGYPTNQT
jgi:hypothetical protein